jgi:hypothetical protein
MSCTATWIGRNARLRPTPTGTTVNKAIYVKDFEKQTRCTTHCNDDDRSRTPV